MRFIYRVVHRQTGHGKSHVNFATLEYWLPYKFYIKDVFYFFKGPFQRLLIYTNIFIEIYFFLVLVTPFADNEITVDEKLELDIKEKENRNIGKRK